MKSKADHFEVITNIQAFNALQSDWDDLRERSSQHRFSQSFAWCWTTWEVIHGPSKRQLHCIVARNRGRLVLIWPLVVYRRSFPSVVAPLGCFAEYPDPLVEDGPETMRRVQEAWRTLRKTCSCDRIVFSFVREGSELNRLMIQDQQKPVAKVPYPYVDFRDYENWESYYSRLRTGDRASIRRRRRRLGERGRVTFEVIEGEECAPLIDWALAEKVKQLAQKKRPGGHWLKAKAYRNLLVWAASRGDRRGRVIMFALRLDDQILATQLCRADETRVEALNSVYDEAYSRFGPGIILKVECLKWAFERQLEFDMRIRDFPHKRRWANRKSTAITYEVTNSTLYALCRRWPILLTLFHAWRKIQA